MRVPAILVTIIDGARTAFDAIRLGATDYVTKPFEEADLRLRIRRALTEPESGDQALSGVRPLSHRVLLIDGDVGTRAALIVGLSRDCRIQAVPSLALAIGELARSVPDLVVVRFENVGGTPARCLAALRSHFPSGPLILIASREVAPHGLGNGGPTVIIGDFFTKFYSQHCLKNLTDSQLRTFQDLISIFAKETDERVVISGMPILIRLDSSEAKHLFIT